MGTGDEYGSSRKRLLGFNAGLCEYKHIHKS